MSARNFYIMQSAVEPMQSELPCYTPLTNHATDVHTVPLVFASDYDTLRTANQRLEGEVKALLEALTVIANTRFNWRESSARLMAESAQAALRGNGGDA
jgi:hypothetical protein